MTDFQLWRNAFGHLVFESGEGERHEGVVPVRAFPIAAPDEGIALVSMEGHELAWVDRLVALPLPQRTLVEEELASREFIPAIRRIVGVSTFATPSTWEVDTDRGTTHFILKGEEGIRRIGANSLLIADMHGIQFLIRDPALLDKVSRKILDRFL